MKYKIGDVARILGISTDLLRYYEKKGVVKPEKNEHNDYRYYDSWDINFLMDCLWFKNYGFSIEQIAGIVKIPGVDDLDTLFAEKEDELRRNMRRSELLLLRSEQYREDLKKTHTLLDRCEIADCPAFVCFVNREGHEYALGGETQRLARHWLEAMPFNRRYFEINADALLPGGEDNYRWGFSLGLDFVEKLGFSVASPMITVPVQRCIHTVFKSAGGRDGFSPALLRYALDYAAENGLSLTGTAHGVLLASVMEPHGLTGYFEAWLPLADPAGKQVPAP